MQVTFDWTKRKTSYTISPFRLPTDIAVSVTADALKTKLEMLDDVGALKVTREGNCAGYAWTTEWTTLGGDHPQMEASVNNFIADVLFASFHGL